MSPPPSAPPRHVLPPPPEPRPKQPVDRVRLLSAGLAVLVIGLTVLGLAYEENGVRAYDTYTTWAIFATVMAAAHLVPLVWTSNPRRAFEVAAVATGGLAFYWAALVLRDIGTGTSFALTLAVSLAVANCLVLRTRR